MTGARYFAKQRERQRDAQIKAMRDIAGAPESVAGSTPAGVSTGAGSQPAASGARCPVSASPGKAPNSTGTFLEYLTAQRSSSLPPVRFADNIDGAIVAMPIIAVHENTRAVAYVSRVVRRGQYGGPRLRVAVYDGRASAREVRVMTRSERGWEFMGDT
jgi:hypothetical protein